MKIKRVIVSLVILLFAAAAWLPLLRFFFSRPTTQFYSKKGISAQANQLAARQLKLWNEPTLHKIELERMRHSNSEWDFMGRTFLVWSLANLSLRNPDSVQKYLAVMDQIIDETLELEKQKGIYFFLMPYAKDRPFSAKPDRSLFLDSEIAMMLASRRVIQEKEHYQAALSDRVNSIDQSFRQSKSMLLESYPDECWMFDHVVGLAALRMADFLDKTDHSAFFRDWLNMAKRCLIDKPTGLLMSSFTLEGKPLDGPEGSSIWMIAHCLQLVDPQFGQDQYLRARKELGRITLGFGYSREWPVSWKGSTDIDSGPIIPVFNISAGASGMAFIGATAFEDDQFLLHLMTTLNFAAFPTRRAGELKFCASNQVGDAALLYAATLGPLWEKVRIKL